MFPTADSKPERTRDGVHVSARHLLRAAEGESEAVKGQNLRGPGRSTGQDRGPSHLANCINENCMLFSSLRPCRGQGAGTVLPTAYFDVPSIPPQKMIFHKLISGKYPKNPINRFSFCLVKIMMHFHNTDRVSDATATCLGRSWRSWWTTTIMAIYFRSSPSQCRIGPLCS